jgi:hypothetical protein
MTAYETGRRVLGERWGARTVGAAIGGREGFGDSGEDVGARSRRGGQRRGRVGLTLGRLLALREMFASGLPVPVALEEVVN